MFYANRVCVARALHLRTGKMHTHRTMPWLRFRSIIALTSLAVCGDEENIYAVRYDGYIAKPFHYRNFLAMVEQTLDRSAAECADRSADRSDHRMLNLNAVSEWSSGHSNGR